MNPTIEIIVPTTATKEREASLFEAIESILSQSSVTAIPRVIVNGDFYDRSVYSKLKSRDDIFLHYFQLGSLPNAIFCGRNLVQSKYYGFLDDDDLLLEGALSVKMENFFRSEKVDVVVGNGYIDRLGSDVLMQQNLSVCKQDPLRSLVDKNWLASCGGLYRTETTSAKYFSQLPKYHEWTWVAFNLAFDRKRISFVNEPTFRVRDTIESLSKEVENTMEYVRFVEMMYAKCKGEEIASEVKRKLGAAYHAAAELQLNGGFATEAWKYHLKSLNTLENLKYLSFTRHLVG